MSSIVWQEHALFSNYFRHKFHVQLAPHAYHLMPQSVLVKEITRLMVKQIILCKIIVCHFWHFTGPCFDESRGLECDDRGMYRPLQCRGNSCWCVDPENGTEIMNTRINKRSARRLPECTDRGTSVTVNIVFEM